MLCSFLRGSRLEEDIGTTMGGGGGSLFVVE